VKRARQILDSSAKWNRGDTRVCPAGEKTFNLYCALEQASDEVSGAFEHREAAMQEARFVIDAIAPKANYNHRLMDYNNDPKTTFADIRKVFDLLEQSIEKRLAEQGAAPPAPPSVTKADIEVVRHALAILDSPSKWNRDRTQTCSPDAAKFNLYCALAKADIEVTGKFDESCVAMKEARHAIDETPNASTYQARLVDYNTDPSTTLADVQKLLRLVEDRLSKRMAGQPDR
jgi:hypothetical protein